MNQENRENTAKTTSFFDFLTNGDFFRSAEDGSKTFDDGSPDDARAAVSRSADASATSAENAHQVDWGDLADYRVLRLFQVAAAASGLPIERSRRKAALEKDPARKKRCDELKHYLRRKLTRQARDGLVTQLDCPEDLFYAKVDVWSAIRVLKTRFDDLPAEFLALEPLLKSVPLSVLERSGAFMPDSENTAKATERSRNDQSTGNATKAGERAGLVLVAMAMELLEFQPDDPSDLKRVVERIDELMRRTVGQPFGTGPGAIKGMLQCGLELCAKQQKTVA